MQKLRKQVGDISLILLYNSLAGFPKRERDGKGPNQHSTVSSDSKINSFCSNTGLPAKHEQKHNGMPHH